jgi:hypothetical protein
MRHLIMCAKVIGKSSGVKQLRPDVASMFNVDEQGLHVQFKPEAKDALVYEIIVELVDTGYPQSFSTPVSKEVHDNIVIGSIYDFQLVDVV